MKTVLFVLFASSLALAEQGPIVTKSSGGGYMHPDYVSNETCRVYVNKVEITRTYGSGETKIVETEVRSINVTGDIAEVVKKARAEKVEQKPNNLCDGPVTSVYLSNDEGGVLFTTGACGMPRKERMGPFSSRLVKIASNYCQVTYDNAR